MKSPRELEIESAGLIERVEKKTLFREADLSGAGDMAIVSFECLVGYLVQQECVSHALHAGKELRKISAYCDVGRFGNSVMGQSVLDDTRRFCFDYGVDMSSSLHVVITAKQVVTPVMLRPELIRCGIFGRRIFTKFPNDWSENRASLQAVIDYRKANSSERVWPEDNGARLKEIERGEEVIWRSNWTEEQNAMAREYYAARWIDSVKEGPLFHATGIELATPSGMGG